MRRIKLLYLHRKRKETFFTNAKVVVYFCIFLQINRLKYSSVVVVSYASLEYIKKNELEKITPTRTDICEHVSCLEGN